jgi:hypothetical protein
MATNFEKKSLFAEHLKGSSSSSGQRPGRGGDNSATLDDLFCDAPSVPANRANKPGRISVKTW